VSEEGGKEGGKARERIREETMCVVSARIPSAI